MFLFFLVLPLCCIFLLEPWYVPAAKLFSRIQNEILLRTDKCNCKAFYTPLWWHIFTLLAMLKAIAALREHMNLKAFILWPDRLWAKPYCKNFPCPFKKAKTGLHPAQKTVPAGQGRWPLIFSAQCRTIQVYISWRTGRDRSSMSARLKICAKGSLPTREWILKSHQRQYCCFIR